LCGEVVPQLKREVSVGGAQATDEMVFECLNRTLSCIGAVIIWLDKLYLPSAGSHERFDGGRCLIVGNGEGRR
jgi:hypothetical protein